MRVKLIHPIGDNWWIELLPGFSFGYGEGLLGKFFNICVGWLFWEVKFSFPIGKVEEDFGIYGKR